MRGVSYIYISAMMAEDEEINNFDWQQLLPVSLIYFDEKLVKGVVFVTFQERFFIAKSCHSLTKRYLQLNVKPCFKYPH